MPAIVYGELNAAGDEVVLEAVNANPWDISDIQDRLKFCTPDIKPNAEGVITAPLSWVALTQIVHSFPDTNRFVWTPSPQLSSWIVQEVIRRSCQGDLLGETPERSPMPHQSAGAIAIGMNGRFLLADEPGAGKTTAALMGLAELAARNRDPFPAVVVCPAAVIDPWLEEVAKVYPGWTAVAYRGPNRKRWLGAVGVNLLVMSYETMRNDTGESGKEGPLMSYPAGTVIFDESHKLCGYQTKQSVRARRLAKHIPNVIAMSGTPITKNAGNFWPVLNSMFPDSYPSRDRYKARYTMDKGQDYGFEIGGLDPLREPEFRLVMQGTMRRVAKADVLKDLPPKSYQTRWVHIPPKWRAAYEEMAADMIAHLPDVEHTTALTAMSTLAKMMRLRQLASSACDVSVELSDEIDEVTGELKELVHVTPKEPCWKGDAVLEILAELHQDADGFLSHGQITHGHRPAVVFSPFKTLVRLCGAMAERKGYKVGYIVGGMSDRQRTEARLAFQNHELDAIFVTTGAGGTGLTLTAAQAEIFVNCPWSLVEYLQAVDRGHRPGQVNPLMIYNLECADSVEADVREALHDKAGNLSELLADPRIAAELMGGRRALAA